MKENTFICANYNFIKKQKQVAPFEKWIDFMRRHEESVATWEAINQKKKTFALSDQERKYAVNPKCEREQTFVATGIQSWTLIFITKFSFDDEGRRIMNYCIKHEEKKIIRKKMIK